MAIQVYGSQALVVFVLLYATETCLPPILKIWRQSHELPETDVLSQLAVVYIEEISAIKLSAVNSGRNAVFGHKNTSAHRNLRCHVIIVLNRPPSKQVETLSQRTCCRWIDQIRKEKHDLPPACRPLEECDLTRSREATYARRPSRYAMR